ncbi:uncharacterized protein LOC123301626 isoform X2 [Chrysoperla carnea]|uniref:uncharacterized protein LOC123301626 isoform X1 n=1 Tax=Chrysoperla carnea TaxID=189513 RepID=UPI001D061213|nr:uncharacterized protein LOC123301626 isoform X1 [Chrysoperla carnea]XP_044740394.1 uncharacterized protein LOC123301626 isoform X2 [Chrysoperla carnea]
MKFIVLTLAFVCLAQNVFGAPNQAPASDTPNLESLVNNFNAALLEGTKNLLGEDAVKNLKETSNLVAGEVNKFIEEIGKKSKELEPEAKEAVKKFQDSINEQLAKFKKENPEVAASAEKIQQQLEATVKKVVEESKVLEKNLKDNSSGIIADLQKLTKETIDKATAQAKELQAKLTKKP